MEAFDQRKFDQRTWDPLGRQVRFLLALLPQFVEALQSLLCPWYAPGIRLFPSPQRHTLPLVFRGGKRKEYVRLYGAPSGWTSCS